MDFGYFKSAWRGIVGQRSYAILNLTGLTIGFAAALFIFIFVSFETGFDSFLPGGENIYRVETNMTFPGEQSSPNSMSAGPVLEALVSEIPEIEHAARIFYQSGVVTHGADLYRDTISAVDPAFFDIFQLEFIEGDAGTAIPDLGAVALSETLAHKYFGDEPALGKTLEIAGRGEVRVGGVYRDLPVDSHLFLDMVLLVNREDVAQWYERWFWTNFYTYIKVAPETNAANLQARLPDVVEKHLATQLIEFGMSQYSPSDLVHLNLVALRDIHLESAERGAMKGRGSKALVTGLGFLGVLILIIAGINFVNLTTARATRRAREVGLRKLAGASRTQLVAQFLGESVILSLVAIVCAMGFVEVTLPWINAVLDQSLTLDVLYSLKGMLLVLLVGTLFGIASGIYPASFLVHLSPGQVLHGGRTVAGGGSLFRNILVFIQFAVSIAAMQVTLIVFLQNRYASDFDLGFERENKMVIRSVLAPEVAAVQETLRQELLKHPDTLGVTYSNHVPSDEGDYSEGIRLPGQEDDDRLTISVQAVDHDFFATYGVPIIAGRSFDRERSNDVLHRRDPDSYGKEAAVIVNRAALTHLQLGSPEEAIGKSFQYLYDPDGSYVDVTVVGVVENIYYRSLRSPVRPALFAIDEGNFRNLTISFRADDPAEYAAFVDETWARLVPARPISRLFLADNIDALYANENTASGTFSAAALLAVLVSCLGLYGLALYAAERRTREIGIRKVLGARVQDIVQLMLWQFSKPVVLANLVAWPVAFLIAGDWLARFHYRIDLGLLPLALTAAAALTIAWATVAYQAIRAARTNPVYALRCE